MLGLERISPKLQLGDTELCSCAPCSLGRVSSLGSVHSLKQTKWNGGSQEVNGWYRENRENLCRCRPHILVVRGSFKKGSMCGTDSTARQNLVSICRVNGGCAVYCEPWL